MSTVSLNGHAIPEKMPRFTFFATTRGQRRVGAKTLLPPPAWSHVIATRSGPPCVGRSTALPTPRCWRPPGSTTTRSMHPKFLEHSGTIYLMGSPGAQHSVAPIVAALIEDIVDESRRQAADSATRRLESALLLMLDECANIAPLGDLPKLVAELGGLGITTAVILQSVASARNVWGEAGERALRDLANITLVWGGQKDISFLTEISRLAGDHDEQVETTTYGPSGKVSSWTARRTAVLPIEDIANLPPHHAVVVSSHLRPRIAHLPPWRGDRHLAALWRP